MKRLPEHWQRMMDIANEQNDIELLCRQHDLNFEIVKRIADSTPFSLTQSFEVCLRQKEANDDWLRLQTRQRA